MNLHVVEAISRPSYYKPRRLDQDTLVSSYNQDVEILNVYLQHTWMDRGRALETPDDPKFLFTSLFPVEENSFILHVFFPSTALYCEAKQ